MTLTLPSGNTSDTRCIPCPSPHPPFHAILLNQLLSYNSTPFRHYLPGSSGRSRRLKTQSHRLLPRPDFRCQSQVQMDTCTSDGYKSEVPTTPSLGWINLLEWLEELRKTVCLLLAGSLYKDTVKDTDEHTQMVEKRGPVCGKACEAPLPSLGAPLSQPLHVLSKPCNWGFLWRLHCIGTID